MPTTADRRLIESVRQEVSNPAFGLVVTGIFYWVTIPLAFALWTMGMFDLEAIRQGLWWCFFMQPALAGGLLTFAGLKMKRLELYLVAIAASIAPFVILVVNLTHMLWLQSFGFCPGDLVGPPMGLWGLVILTRPQVRAAFAHMEQEAVGP